MNQILMDSFVLLGKSMIDKARRKGFDILLLLAGIIALGWWCLRLDSAMAAREIRWEAKLDRANTEWAAALNSANMRILECERDKYDLSVRVAILEMVSAKIKKR